MRRLKRTGAAFFVVWALVLGLTLEAQAGYNSVLGAIESSGEATHVRIPFLGVARFAIKVTRPHGVASMRLAMFEDHHVADSQAFDAMVGRATGHKWHRMVAVWSKRDGENTYIYMKGTRRYLKLLIVNHEDEETVVVQVKVNPDRLGDFLENPSESVGRLARADRDD